MKLRELFFAILVVGLVYDSHGQVLYPDDYNTDYYELLLNKNYDQMKQPSVIHPSIIAQYGSDSLLNWDLWNGKFKYNFKTTQGKFNFQMLNPEVTYTYNSKYPRGYNDGAVWKGKGNNFNLTGGFSGNFGVLHYSFAPVVFYSQNQDFNIPTIGLNKNELSYPFQRNIDWVQRYGYQENIDFNLGQSEIRLVHRNITVGLSTANLTWGPAEI